jgi:signal transduction histidine kinase/ActR/RegA family two-component response regulator
MLGVANRPGGYTAADQAQLEVLAHMASVLYDNYRRSLRERSLQEELRQAQKMDAIGRLAGGIAHDFNNLLTVILGRSQVALRRLSPDDPLRRSIALIAETAERAGALVQQLLAFSRKQLTQPRVLVLTEVVTRLEQMLRRLIGEDVELVTTFAPDLGRVKADPSQLEQVLVNLAVNARDAMPTGGRLTIETENVQLDLAFARRHRGARPGPYVRLSVSDTGVGMDAVTRARIFEPFFTTKEPGKGTGLGLATVYGIVKQSDGYIAVDSEPGHGARFDIYLPRVDAPPEPLPAAPALGARGGSETLLLVEDEPALRDMTREILELHGYTVIEAGSGADALDVAARHPGPIHLLLTDVVLPRMGGRQLAERLVAQRPETKVLFMSGYTDDALGRHGALDPGVVLLPKPFAPDALARAVRQALDTPGPGRGSAPPAPVGG